MPKIHRPTPSVSTPKAASHSASKTSPKAATQSASANQPSAGNSVSKYEVDFHDDSFEHKEVWFQKADGKKVLQAGTDAWNPDPNNVIEAGKPFTVSYHRPGIMGHRDLTPEQVQANNDSMMDDGGMVYSPDYLAVQYTKVEVQYRINGGEVKTLELSEPPGFNNEFTRNVDIPIPEATTGNLEYWFKLEGSDGQTHFDSNFSQNYHATIVPKDSIPTPLSFRGTPE